MKTHELARELLKTPNVELEIKGWVSRHKLKVVPCEYNDGETYILVDTQFDGINFGSDIDWKVTTYKGKTVLNERSENPIL